MKAVDHEDARSQLLIAFESCDSNADGHIDQREFHMLLEKLDGDVSREESQLAFEAADADGDGLIDFKEFAAWWTN